MLQLILIAITVAIVVPQSAASTDPALQPLLDKIGRYVSTYGERASMFVGTEKYTQSVTLAAMNPDAPPLRPRQLVAEFAIVKVPGGWVGYRDVVQIGNEKVTDRRDRLVSILTDPRADASIVTQLANESARYNIGPVSRNFNTPTATLFFFSPDQLGRFTFEAKERKKIEGMETVEVAYRELRRPTLVQTRSGKDVPLEGSLWVIPADGTVVRSRLVLRNFADELAPTTAQGRPGGRIRVNPRAPGGTVGGGIDVDTIESLADIEVTYARHQEYGIWLPSRMTENYSGAVSIQKSRPPEQGTAITRATYSDYKQFGADVRINIPR